MITVIISIMTVGRRKVIRWSLSKMIIMSKIINIIWYWWLPLVSHSSSSSSYISVRIINSVCVKVLPRFFTFLLFLVVFCIEFFGLAYLTINWLVNCTHLMMRTPMVSFIVCIIGLFVALFCVFWIPLVLWSYLPLLLTLGLYTVAVIFAWCKFSAICFAYLGGQLDILGKF